MPWEPDESGTRLPWEKPKFYSGNIPTLGIELESWHYKSKNNPHYGYITFYIRPDKAGFTGMEKWNRFMGRLSTGLDFFSTNDIKRAHIIKIYGEPSTNINFPEHSYMTFQQQGISYSMRFKKNGEWLDYPSNGILFILSSNILTRLSVYRERHE